MQTRCLFDDSELSVYQLPVLQDNFVYVLHNSAESVTAVIDPSVGPAIEAFLREKDWHLDFIWNTHHHNDHIGGNEYLRSLYGAKVYASVYDQKRIDGVDRALRHGDTVSLGALDFAVWETPGHTLGHIVYLHPRKQLLFCGDTLFALGCGRLFEGTAAQMWKSLKQFQVLPPETLICCSHEYTLSNARFVESLRSNSEGFAAYHERLIATRALGQATVPTRLQDELLWNPFLKATTPEDFAVLRSSKDSFRG